MNPELLVESFPKLEMVHYTQLGNCVYAPSKENGFNQYASIAGNTELVESVKARSASLVLLRGVVETINAQREARASETVEVPKDVQLIAVANVLSARERVVCFSFAVVVDYLLTQLQSLVLNINQRCVLSRNVVSEGHFFD